MTEAVQRYAQILSQENDLTSQRGYQAMKGIFAAVWPALALEDRQNFLARANVDGTFLKPSHRLDYLMKFPQIYQAMKDWRRVSEGCAKEHQDFVSSIARQMEKGNSPFRMADDPDRKGWLPSDKQAGMMIRIHSEVMSAVQYPDDLEVTE